RAEVAARALGVRLQFVEARGPADIDRASSDMTRARADALIVLGDPMFFAERRRLVDLAAKHRLPALYSARDSVDAGGSDPRNQKRRGVSNDSTVGVSRQHVARAAHTAERHHRLLRGVDRAYVRGA